eukprot:gene8465-17807_t
MKSVWHKGELVWAFEGNNCYSHAKLFDIDTSRYHDIME